MSRSKRAREEPTANGVANGAERNNSGGLAAQNEVELGDPADAPEPDTILSLQGGAELPVHGFLLRLASPVLRVALAVPKVNGRWQVNLPEDPLDAWKVLYQAISPDADDVFITGPLRQRAFKDQLTVLRDVMGLAHKYGIERVVQVTCQFVQDQYDAAGAATCTQPEAVRAILLWLNMLQRLSMQAQYDAIYSSLIRGHRVTRATVLAAVGALRQAAPPVLLHSQLLTDLLLQSDWQGNPFWDLGSDDVIGTEASGSDADESDADDEQDEEEMVAALHAPNGPQENAIAWQPADSSDFDSDDDLSSASSEDEEEEEDEDDDDSDD